MFHIASATTIPEIPAHLSSTAHDFLSLCFDKSPDTRASATELLHHPFLRKDTEEKTAAADVLRSMGATPRSDEFQWTEESRREELLEIYLVHWEQSVLDKWRHELWFRILGRWIARARRTLARRRQLAQKVVVLC